MAHASLSKRDAGTSVPVFLPLWSGQPNDWYCMTSLCDFYPATPSPLQSSLPIKLPSSIPFTDGIVWPGLSPGPRFGPLVKRRWPCQVLSFSFSSRKTILWTGHRLRGRRESYPGHLQDVGRRTIRFVLFFFFGRLCFRCTVPVRGRLTLSTFFHQRVQRRWLGRTFTPQTVYEVRRTCWQAYQEKCRVPIVRDVCLTAHTGIPRPLVILSIYSESSTINLSTNYLHPHWCYSSWVFSHTVSGEHIS